MKRETEIAIIIPARYDSTRFPGKPLSKIAGKPMLEWVIEKALGSKLANRIIVATDDKKIFDFALGAGLDLPSKHVEVIMTLKDHKCGTDRIAEVVRHNPDIKYIVNLQGDEPLMPSEYIDKVLESVLSEVQKHRSTEAQCSMASLVAPIENENELNNPNIVKVVMDRDGYALYFSRSPIPFNRSSSQSSILNPNNYFKHIGIYGYTRESLLEFGLLPPSSLEQIEQLEQLRALENGFKIKLVTVEKAYPAVDKPEDLKVVEEVLSVRALPQ